MSREMRPPAGREEKRLRRRERRPLRLRRLLSLLSVAGQEKTFNLKWDMLIRETQRLADEKQQFERKKKFYEQVESSSIEAYHEEEKTVQGDMFFSGVSTQKALKKRYKDLIKIYHPDSESGDTATIAEINREYEDLRANMN